MKKIIVLSILLIVSGASFSQQTTTNTPLTKADYLQKSIKQKTAAWVLLGGGSALVVTGVLLSNNASFDNLGTTATIAIVGGLSMLGSIPLFIASGKNKRKANAATAFFKMEKTPVIQQTGFVYQSYPALSIKFRLNGK